MDNVMLIGCFFSCYEIFFFVYILYTFNINVILLCDKVKRMVLSLILLLFYFCFIYRPFFYNCFNGFVFFFLLKELINFVRFKHM